MNRSQTEARLMLERLTTPVQKFQTGGTVGLMSTQPLEERSAEPAPSPAPAPAPSYASRQDIEGLYQGVFGRAADQPGLDYWTQAAQQNMLTPDQIRQSFLADTNNREWQALSPFDVNQDQRISPEERAAYNTDMIQKAYQGIFGREADPEGLAYWQQSVAKNMLNPERIRQSFLESGEWTSLSPYDVDRNQSISPGERQTYTQAMAARDELARLNRGATNLPDPNTIGVSPTLTEQVAAPKIASEQDIVGIYRDVFGRAPDQAGLEYWKQASQDYKLTPQQILDTFVGSKEWGTLSPFDIDVNQRLSQAERAAYEASLVPKAPVELPKGREPMAMPEAPPALVMPTVQTNLVPSVTPAPLDTAARNAPVRTYDPVTGSFQYTNPTKLSAATGSGMDFVPATVTSRPRQLLNVGFTPGGGGYDPATGTLYQPAMSASQRYGADRTAQQRALQSVLGTPTPATQINTSDIIRLQSRLRAGEFTNPDGSINVQALQSAYNAVPRMNKDISKMTFGSEADRAYYSKFDTNRDGLMSPMEHAAYLMATASAGASGTVPRGFESLGPVSFSRFAKGGPVTKKADGGDVSRETLPPNRASTLKGYGEGDEAEYARKSAREALRAMVGMKPYDEASPTEAYRIASTPTPLTAAAGIVKGGGKGLRSVVDSFLQATKGPGVIERAKQSTFMKGPGMTVEPETFSKAELLSRLQDQGFDTNRLWLRGKRDTGLDRFIAPPNSYDTLEEVYRSIHRKPPDEAVESALRDSQRRPYSPGRTLSRQREDRNVTKFNTKGGVWLTESPNIAHTYAGDKGYVIPAYAPKPDVVLDAKGEQWADYFKQSEEWKRAFKDPNVNTIEVKNIIDAGPHTTKVVDLDASEEEIRAALTSSNLFIKKPQEGNMPAVNMLTGEAFPYRDGGEVSTKDFIAKFAEGSPNPDEVPSVIDEREEIRSESQRMLNRLSSQSKLPPGLQRTIQGARARQGESMIPAAVPARDVMAGMFGAQAMNPGSEAYRTGQALANSPPVEVLKAPVKMASAAGDAATALAALGGAGVIKSKGGNWLSGTFSVTNTAAPLTKQQHSSKLTLDPRT